MSGERVGGFQGTHGFEGAFQVGTGPGAVQMEVGEGRNGARSSVGAALQSLADHQATVDVSYGTSHLGALTPAQLRTLSGLNTTEQRLDALSSMLRSQGQRPNFDYRGNSVRILNALCRLDTPSVTQGAIVPIRLSAASNDAVEGTDVRRDGRLSVGRIVAHPPTSPMGSLDAPRVRR